MELLHTPTACFKDIKLHLSAAIIDSDSFVVRKVKSNVWRPSFKAYSDKEDLERAMLVLKKAHDGRVAWELPHGTLDANDVDIEAALCRIVRTLTGLDVSRVLGAPIAPGGWHTSNGTWHYEFLYVVLVHEVSSIDMVPYTEVQLSLKHDDRCWVRNKDEVAMLPHKSSSVAVSIMTHAFTFQPKTWHPSMSYLSMTPNDAMMYPNSYAYLIAAAIVRSSPVGPPAILLLQRAQLPSEPAAFELIGGRLFSDKATVEQALRDKVLDQCGLIIKDIHGSIYDKPEVKLSHAVTSPAVKEAGQVRLEYLVTVEADGPIVHSKKYMEWRWIESEQEAETMYGEKILNKTCLRSVTRALEVVRELATDAVHG